MDSTNTCDGDDCDDSDYPCANSNRETFTMSSLDAGSYLVWLAAYNPDEAGGWSLKTICGAASDSDTPSPTIWSTTPSPTWGPLDLSIGCNESLSDTYDGEEYINFTLSEEQDVTFTNCQRYCTLRMLTH